MGDARIGFIEHVHETRLNFSKLFSEAMHRDLKGAPDISHQDRRQRPSNPAASGDPAQTAAGAAPDIWNRAPGTSAVAYVRKLSASDISDV